MPLPVSTSQFPACCPGTGVALPHWEQAALPRCSHSPTSLGRVPTGPLPAHVTLWLHWPEPEALGTPWGRVLSAGRCPVGHPLDTGACVRGAGRPGGEPMCHRTARPRAAASRQRLRGQAAPSARGQAVGTWPSVTPWAKVLPVAVTHEQAVPTVARCQPPSLRRPQTARPWGTLSAGQEPPCVRPRGDEAVTWA